MVRISRSRIDGQGLFAAQDITKGTRIIAYTGEKISRRESARRLEAGNAYIFHLNYRYALDGATLENTARYINHSCDPNCTVEKTNDTLWIVALRDIKAGEELSYNYGYEFKHYQDNPCNCGAKNCCGYILDRQYWELIPTTLLNEASRGGAFSCARDRPGDGAVACQPPAARPHPPARL